MIQAIQRHSLSLAETRAWALAAIFICGNIILPQLCHLIPQGGRILRAAFQQSAPTATGSA